MKTALQELIKQIDERIEKSKEFIKNQDELGVGLTTFLIAGFMDSKLFAENLLEMEKEQIVKAYNESFLLRHKPYATGEKYYKETFIKSNYPEIPASSKQQEQ